MIALARLVAIIVSLCGCVYAADQYRTAMEPVSATGVYRSTEHNVGSMVLGIHNSGTFGMGYSPFEIDCFTGRPTRICQYPKGDPSTYLYSGMLWIGGIIGTDTLVSVGLDGWSGGRELHPDDSDDAQFKFRSVYSSGSARTGAVSEQDFVTTYYDTCVANCPGLARDEMDNRLHKPLNIRIDQRSYAWSHRTIANAVVFDMKIKNIGTTTINKMYLGIYVDADVYSTDDPLGFYDDFSGFFSSVPDTANGCPIERQIPTAWSADISGCLQHLHTAPNVTATALLSGPPSGGAVSFNWWVSNGNSENDFGPTRIGHHRDFGTGGSGTPVGDRNKYWVLGNGDIDYDQPLTTTIYPSDTIWEFAGWSRAVELVKGSDTRYLLSVGPYDVEPGGSVPLVFAFIGGKQFHTVEDNPQYLPDQPLIYEENLGFYDLQRNVKNAVRVYDNPGIDTDSDGYFGEFVVCGLDTNWIAGDGVPDFRVSAPPVTPELRVTPQPGGVVLRWNGITTERDRWSVDGRLDFEGYNVYLKRTTDTAASELVASYDIEDYFKVALDATNNLWLLNPEPQTTDELRCLYANSGCHDTSWLPSSFTQSHPLKFSGVYDSLFYFFPIGCNAYRFGHETPILKSYPNAPKPSWSRVSDVPVDSLPFYVTDDGYFKYYEYELTLNNLIPADTYLVSVTALDFGKASLTEYTPLETPVDEGQKIVVPLARLSCCSALTGNVDCSPAGSIDIADLTALIDYLYVSLSPLCCVGEANTDGDPSGVIDIADLTRLIDFLYVSFTAPAGCE